MNLLRVAKDILAKLSRGRGSFDNDDLCYTEDMKNDLLIQYGAIRQTIKTNVQTIGQLIQQAENLKKIIESITDAPTKASLEQEVKKLQDTIGTLINQTDELFDKYDQFVDTVFK